MASSLPESHKGAYMGVDMMQEGKAVVFNIQRFSVHDGPGIRTTVFIKGCPLDCKWCGNPESKEPAPMLITRDINCVGCGKCVDACPQHAIAMLPDKGRFIDFAACDQCLACVDACLYQALNTSGRLMSVDEVLKEVMSDEIFYQTSGGGITVSGGEPLTRSAFVFKLMKACKKRGIHTALDTSGYARWEDFASVLIYTDLVLYDVKHMDNEKHIVATRVENRLILENLKKAARLTEVWIRIPLIAGYNDDQKNHEKIALLTKSLNITRVSLLPYHQGGQSKCEQLGVDYPIPNAKPPSDEVIRGLAFIYKKLGIDVVIGG